MLNLTPFLLFNGNCAEAMTFYQSCLGGDLTLQNVYGYDRVSPPTRYHFSSCCDGQLQS